MKVYVHLLGYLAQYSPTSGEEFTMDLAGEAVVAELLEALKFPAAL